VSADFAFYYKLIYYTIMEALLKLVLPLAILLYTNISIYRLVSRKKSKTLTSVTKTPERRIVTLLVIVIVFLLCNILKLVINCSDMVHYREILACQAQDNYDMDVGFSQFNTSISRIGK